MAAASAEHINFEPMNLEYSKGRSLGKIHLNGQVLKMNECRGGEDRYIASDKEGARYHIQLMEGYSTAYISFSQGICGQVYDTKEGKLYVLARCVCLETDKKYDAGLNKVRSKSANETSVIDPFLTRGTYLNATIPDKILAEHNRLKKKNREIGPGYEIDKGWVIFEGSGPDQIRRTVPESEMKENKRSNADSEDISMVPYSLKISKNGDFMRSLVYKAIMLTIKEYQHESGARHPINNRDKDYEKKLSERQKENRYERNSLKRLGTYYEGRGRKEFETGDVDKIDQNTMGILNETFDESESRGKQPRWKDLFNKLTSLADKKADTRRVEKTK